MGRSTIVSAIIILVVVGLVVLWALGPSGQEQVAAAPLAEVTDTGVIQNHVQISHLNIATSENFVGQKIRVIGLTLRNISDKPIRMIELKMAFTDYDGKSVKDYTQKVLEPKQKALMPGAEFRPEVRLENLPRTWNYRVPVTEITKIGY